MLLFSVWAAVGFAATPVELADDRPIDLAETGRLFQSENTSFPDSAQGIAQSLAQFAAADKVSLFGGSYWLYAEFRHSQATTQWIFDPNNTLIDRVEARIYAADGSVQQVETGYRGEHEYMLHYGKAITLQPNVDYRVLIHFSSPYFASNPRLEMLPESNYRAAVIKDNMWIIGCLGAVVSLALFNWVFVT